jgi:hypothetical protein
MMSEETVIECLQKLSDLLGIKGIVGEIDIAGGAAMMLAFHARQATKDVDAIFAPVSEIREAARLVASEMDLSEGWLNDAVNGFQDVPQFPHLRVLTPASGYMLAMKVMAARAGNLGSPGDKRDILFLVARLGLTSSEQVMEIVERYYEPARILPRSIYVVDEVIAELTR